MKAVSFPKRTPLKSKSTKNLASQDAKSKSKARKKTSTKTLTRNGTLTTMSKSKKSTTHLELETLWDSVAESAISSKLDALIYQCNLMQNTMQDKIDFYYKPYGLDLDRDPVEPIHYDDDDNSGDDEDYYRQKACHKWGAISDAVCNKSKEEFRDMLQSINHQMYPKLREIVGRIMSPEFQKVMTYLKCFPESQDLQEHLAFAKEGVELLDRLIGRSKFSGPYDSDSSDNEIEVNQADENDLIDSLLLLKRGKLESTVNKLTKVMNKKKYKRSLNALTRKMVTEMSRKDCTFIRLATLTNKTKSKLSTKSMPNLSTKSLRKFPISEDEVKLEHKHHTKTPKGSKQKPKSKKSKLTLQSIEEDLHEDLAKDDESEASVSLGSTDSARPNKTK